MNMIKSFLKWLKEDAPANNAGSGEISGMVLPLGTKRKAIKPDKKKTNGKRRN